VGGRDSLSQVRAYALLIRFDVAAGEVSCPFTTGKNCYAARRIPGRIMHCARPFCLSSCLIRKDGMLQRVQMHYATVVVPFGVDKSIVEGQGLHLTLREEPHIVSAVGAIHAIRQLFCRAYHTD